MTLQENSLPNACQLCGHSADLTWPSPSQDLHICQSCAIQKLPSLLAMAALHDIKRAKAWPEVQEIYEDIRHTYWMEVCEALDTGMEGLLDEDDTPPEVIERMDREWERRQASKRGMENNLDCIHPHTLD